MLTDPIADLLTRLRNASSQHHTTVTVSFSTLKEEICRVLQKESFIKEVQLMTENNHPILSLSLFLDKELSLKRISKPGRRIYVPSSDIPKVKSGLGIAILSTSQGVMSNREAKKKNIGGELLCEVF